MEITEEQKKLVAEWFAAGASLDEIQKRLASECGVHLTYLDLRLLVAELPQHEEPAPQPEEPVAQEAGLPDDVPGEDEPMPPYENGAEADDVPPTDDAGKGSVKVDFDVITIPGTLASGDVVFSDGKKGKWFLDRMGRLGLGGDLPQGYRPSPEDAAAFQSDLMNLLHSKGLC